MDSLASIAASASTAETPEAKRTSRIHDAAQQFEALMITQMMKTARETNSDGWLSDGGETGEDSTMDMAEAQFAQAMASHGGLGLAKMIVTTMTPKTGTVSPAVTSQPSLLNATPATVPQPTAPSTINPSAPQEL